MKKISEYKNEDALDLLADLIEPATEIFSDKEIQKMRKEGKAPLKIAKVVLKKHKGSLMELLAALHGCEVSELELTIPQIVSDLALLLKDSELVEVFQSQGQKKGSTSSGSATESTEGGEI